MAERYGGSKSPQISDNKEIIDESHSVGQPPDDNTLKKSCKEPETEVHEQREHFTDEDYTNEDDNSTIKEEERSILTERLKSSLILEQNKELENLEINQAGNTTSTYSLSPPYGVLESSEQTSPSSSYVTDSSPSEPPEDNEGSSFPSPQLVVRPKQRSGAAATLSNVEAMGMVGRISSSTDHEPVNSNKDSLPLFGTVTREGEMVSFVADDLMTKIRQSTSSASTSPANSHKDISPTTTSISSSSSQFSMHSSSLGSSSAIPPVDPTAIQDLEKQCKRVADSLDLMFGHLAGTLHNMSAITVGHTQTYRDAVEKAGVTVDQCVRSMYALMAKCEELQNSMQAARGLAHQIKSIKQQLDELEALCK